MKASHITESHYFALFAFFLKEEGNYFPYLSENVRDPKEFQLYLFQKLLEIFICCNKLSRNIFTYFFYGKAIGPHFKRFFFSFFDAQKMTSAHCISV